MPARRPGSAPPATTLTTRHPFAAINGSPLKPAPRSGITRRVLPRQKTERRQRVHIEPAIRDQPGVRLKPPNRGGQAWTEFAIDSIAIIAVAGEQRLRAYDH